MDTVDLPQKVRKSCCLVFSLQTGIMLIFTTDVMNFILICCLTGMTADNLDEKENLDTAGFTMMTDGICIILFLYRLI